jgi:hypothetical protein
MPLNASEWIAIIAIIVPTAIVFILERMSTVRKLAVMEEKITAQSVRIDQQERHLSDAVKTQEILRESIHTMALTLVKIETHIDLSKSVLERVETLLRSPNK